MKNGFTFGMKSTEDFGMVVEHYPLRRAPVRKRTTISVMGRNGDLHIDEGAFENYQQPYECGFCGEKPTPEQAHEISEWLLSSGAYQRLEDTYDPEYFRLATFSGPLDIENKLNKLGKCVIYFDCAPQSYLKSGQYPISFESPFPLWNPTLFTALPIIKVYGNGAGTVTVGEITVEVKSIEDHIVLDSELGHAYRQVGDAPMENMNGNISAPVFPQLLPGDNAISWTGDITKLEITPRWWKT